MTAHHYGMPGAPPKVSQRRSKPRVLAVPTFQPGDTVRWNGRYSGTVTDIIGDEALVRETASPLGGERTWRLALAALTRVPGPMTPVRRSG